jgi:SAM-dependent methyltransferase
MAVRHALDQAHETFVRVALAPVDDWHRAYHEFASAVSGLCCGIRDAEANGMSRNDICNAIAKARKIHAQSPFIRRLQEWPRGYPGDFETIEYLCDGRVRAEPITPAWFLEHQALRSPAAQQHRNKVAWQASQIASAIVHTAKPRILSIGCGGSRDLRQIQHLISDHDVQIVLNDLDASALELSLNSLGMLKPKVATVLGDIFHAIRHISKQEPFDLIVAGGIFDYLEDRQLTWLLPRLLKLLSTDGILCFTNIGSGNPDRIWIEYCADWFIKERSEAEILLLLEMSGIAQDVCTEFERDTTGLTVMAKIRKKSR